MEWSKINVTSKDVLAALVFTFSASGVYYSLYYEGKMDKEKRVMEKEKSDTKIQGLEQRIILLEQQNNSIKEWQRKIDDENLKRQTIENERYNVYVPLKKTN